MTLFKTFVVYRNGCFMDAQQYDKVRGTPGVSEDYDRCCPRRTNKMVVPTGFPVSDPLKEGTN
jgi:hypothetical protein